MSYIYKLPWPDLSLNWEDLAQDSTIENDQVKENKIK